MGKNIGKNYEGPSLPLSKGLQFTSFEMRQQVFLWNC